MRNQFKIDEEQKELAEKALEVLENHLIHTLDAHRLGILVFDSNGDLISCNKQWERLYQLNYHEIADYNILHDTNLHKKHIWHPVKQAFSGSAGVMEENYFSPEEWGKEGRPRWTEGHCLPVFANSSKDERLIGAAIFLQDITERKTMAWEVEQLRKFISEIKQKQEEICTKLSNILAVEDCSPQMRPESMPHGQHLRDRAVRIPRREREVFEKLASGYSVKEAAHQLGLGVKSVYTYRSRLLKRLRLTGDVELAIAWRELHEEPREGQPDTEINKDLPS